jgi:hypothetical protein
LEEHLFTERPAGGDAPARTLIYSFHEDRTDARHEPTREAAMAAFAKSWGRE